MDIEPGWSIGQKAKRISGASDSSWGSAVCNIKLMAYFPWPIGQDTLLLGTFQNPLHWRDPSKPILKCHHESKVSHKLHPNISISQHSLRILPHGESVLRMTWVETMTFWEWNTACHLYCLSLLKHATLHSTQRNRDNHPKLIGVWEWVLMPSRVGMKSGTGGA